MCGVLGGRDRGQEEECPQTQPRRWTRAVGCVPGAGGAWKGLLLSSGAGRCPGVGSGLCRYNAVTGEWLEDEVLIKMASQVRVPKPSGGTGLGDSFDCSSFQFMPLLLHAHFIVLFFFLIWGNSL